MSSIVFKRLFEIQLVHDYFLTDADGTSFFEKDRDDKREFLTQKLLRNSYNAHQLFSVVPTAQTKLKMKANKLVMRQTALGFMVGTEVAIENQAGTVTYKPSLAFDTSLNLAFSLKPKATVLNSITNMSLTPPLPSIYYFSNKDKEEFTEPVLGYTSLPLAKKAIDHQAKMPHEMGALVFFGATLREAIQATDGEDPTHWEDSTDRRFVSNADRILLPHNFSYKLKKSDAITQFSFVLEDAGGIEIKAKTISGTEILEQVQLNFTYVDEEAEIPEPIVPGLYTLKVTANAGDEFAYPIYLSEELYDKAQWGILDIRFDELDSPFSLLDDQGFLKTRIPPASDPELHPVFELRFKNRRTYWRYNRDEAFVAADLNSHLNLEGQAMVSKKPKGLTEALLPFVNGTSVLMPHPKPAIKVEGNRIISEVFITPSNRLVS